ncbi:UbiX family flavin prenyltransferase [Granulicella cerasi]|uniref:Flavin prenyltransferase UbiX n=1 Tax=Granulicella cerasi TaxID=741063 RepID=A0ABW1ZER8_9BACT
MMMSSNAPVEIALALTGASGAMLAQRMLRALEADTRVARVHLTASDAALRVIAEEMSLSGRNDLAEKLLDSPAKKTVAYTHQDVGAPIASGSYPLHAMVVLPCSMGTLAGIANGSAGNLIERAADVCLKERRRLVLCVRETPLSLIHLRNMTAATEAGATIFPVAPTFYNHPQTLEDMAQNYVDRVLAHIALPQSGAYIWKG